MEIKLTILAPDVDSMSKQWESRVPRLTETDDEGVVTLLESAVEHLDRAYKLYLSYELKAAKMNIARDAVKNAKTDAARKVALLAKYKLENN